MDLNLISGSKYSSCVEEDEEKQLFLDTDEGRESSSSPSASPLPTVLAERQKNEQTQQNMSAGDFDKHRRNQMKTKGTPYTLYGIVIALVVVTYLAFSHFTGGGAGSSMSSVDGVGSTLGGLLDGDRASAYKVKVLSATMSDEELNALPKESFSYLTMIDAGSSGCRAHVYKYGKLGSLDGPLYVLPQHVSKKVKPGLSSFAGNPQDAGKYLADLVQFIQEQVPEEDWAVTPIWLKVSVLAE